jgi:hypothetical protein
VDDLIDWLLLIEEKSLFFHLSDVFLDLLLIHQVDIHRLIILDTLPIQQHIPYKNQRLSSLLFFSFTLQLSHPPSLYYLTLSYRLILFLNY